MMEVYKLLELKFAELNECHPDHMVVCSSGTAALHLALEVARTETDVDVVVPNYTMVSVPRAVVMADMVPSFVGSADDKLLIDTDYVAKMDPRPDVVVLVHTYGRYCKPLPFNGRMFVVEDLAEARGPIGPHNSDAYCWSFYKNKLVAGEEGGAVMFKHAQHAKLARMLRCQGFTDEHDYTHIPRGHNYRLANCLAEKVLVSLYALRENIEKRQDIKCLYNHYCPAQFMRPERVAPWVYDVQIPGLTRERQQRLVKCIPGARCGFWPMSRQQEFSAELGYDFYEQNFDEKAASEVIYFPIQPDVTDEQYISNTFDILERQLQ